MKNCISKNAAMAMVALTLQLSPIVLQSHQVLADDRKYSYVEEEDCNLNTKKKTNKGSEKIDSSKVSTSEEAWLTEGTPEYEVAKKIFEVFTQEYGTSGAFAAGVLSNVKGESNFIPDVMEGGKRAGMNTPYGDAYNSAMPGQEGGGGLFQFTGYSKFTTSKWWKGRPGSEGWAVENQVDAVWGLEFGNRAVEDYFSRTGKTNFSKVEDLISTEDPALASEYFQMAYERPQHFHPERAEWAKKANSVFNKENIKADPSKFKFDTGSSTAVSVKVGSKKDGKEKCVEAEESVSGGAWGKDGEGDHGFGDLGAGSKFFKRDELPDNLKQYALNPESIGVKWKSEEGWTLLYPPEPGQCTELSYAVMSHLWSKGDKKFLTAGDGINVANNAAATYGGKTTSTPKSGAVFSSLGSTSAGHTGVVVHVFKNGDFLMIEQNVGGYSGHANGERNNWSFRLVGKGAIQAEKYQFYYPDGWTVNKDAKTMK